MDTNISRRDFLKGMTATAATVAAASCAPKVDKQSATSSDAPKASEGMAMRTNPRNGDKVSLLGYGCMRWPMIKDADGKDIVDQEKVNELVDRAIEGGVNYFDTSPAYLQGQSERASGNALARHPRKSYYLATKLSNFNVATREASEAMYHRSFEAMQTDYFDYYLLHAIGRGGYDAFAQRYVENGIMDFLLKEREKGKIRQLGFSFHGSQPEFDTMLAQHEKYNFDFVQIEMNYIDWRHADGVRNVNAEYLYEQIDKLGLPMVIMEPLLGGRLSKLPDNIAAMLKERNPSASNASWAFRFVGSFPGVLTALSGMTYMEHLEDNLKTYTDFVPMNEEELAFMEEVAVLMKEYPLVNCTNCKYCMPCPYGIDIPGIFAHYNSAVTEGFLAKDPSEKSYKKLRKAYLTSYNEAIPTVRQADHCIGCHKCLRHCPQSIPIPRELRRIDAYVEKLKRSI